jgi:hypothetical protein
MRTILVPVLALLLAAAPVDAGAATFQVPGGDRDGSSAASGRKRSRADDITLEQERAIDRGLAWLAKQQEPDGSFSPLPAKPRNPASTADARTAVTALATLAFLGAGHGLRRGPYRDKLRASVEWLMDKAQVRRTGARDDGYISFTGDNTSKMHGHGFATLALAEAYATAADSGPSGSGRRRASHQQDFSRRLKESIQAAVDCIIRSQSLTGGWGYTPDSGGHTDHEGSVTVCCVQALLSASNRGFKVPQRNIDLARNYMKKSQADSGGFRYTLKKVTRGVREDPMSFSWALAGAGVTSLLGLAEFDRRIALDRGLKYMQKKEPRPRIGVTPYFFYGSFYATQAFHFDGGERWERYWMPMRSQIIGRQEANGSWIGKDTVSDLGPVYPTALCLLSLEVPIGYLSVFGR